ncbi:hypothetical protein P154DRAFT_233533 [Amniculicola lignicola CBS 123094]|uniref:Stc1 domain-containing protein n=1 Tax=Amniculicola lignicola CBS 123094 TaxID=1392246 RepID=A0A6A5WD80_9PLEO|nr:hypothetical protein P154DRAFT_233533 [Amniculicola lignicola CBS 123094]
MSRKNNKHAYDQSTIARLANVALPDKLKCDRCSKYKNHQGFSQKQLTDARAAVLGRRSYKINCRPCTGAQIVEIECMMCLRTKGLEEFAKVQRTKPDQAKCMECMGRQVGLNPISDETYDEPQKAFQPLDSSAGVQPEYWGHTSSAYSTASVAGDYGVGAEDAGSDDEKGGVSLLGRGLQNISYTGEYTGNNTNNSSRVGTLIDTDDTDSAGNRYGGPVQADDGWQTVKTKSWHTPSGPSSCKSSQPSFDPNRYGNPRSGPSSVSGTARTFSSNFSNPSEEKIGKSGFAKIRAYKPTQVEQVEDDDWKSDESEDDDGDDDDDYTEI